jgi:hypothetical protein
MIKTAVTPTKSPHIFDQHHTGYRLPCRLATTSCVIAATAAMGKQPGNHNCPVDSDPFLATLIMKNCHQCFM